MSTDGSTGAKLSFGSAVRGICVGFVAALALVSVGEVTAQPLPPLPAVAPGASVIGPARPISAWTTFCERYASECSVSDEDSAVVTLTNATWQTLNAVNRRVNVALIAVTDQDHWKTPDRWDLAEDGSGDCEDFQLLKRRMLAEAGLPRRAMRMTVVVDEKGEGHAVLTVVTTRGDLVLDNKTNAILPWKASGYTFIKREREDGRGWVALGRDASPVTSANR